MTLPPILITQARVVEGLKAGNEALQQIQADMGGLEAVALAMGGEVIFMPPLLVWQATMKTYRGRKDDAPAPAARWSG